MNDMLDNLTFTVPLSLKAQRLAKEFSQHQSNPQKAKQVYLNTLAVYAVNFYLDALGIETELAASDSWDLVKQTLADIADLQVKDLGKIECIPLLPDATILQVPPEVWDDRIGYVAVQFDPSLREATLLGFLSGVGEKEELPISQLQSLDYLLKHLSQLKQLQPVKVKPQVTLSQWFENIFDGGWETIESIFSGSSAEFAGNFRGGEKRIAKTRTIPQTLLERGKRLDLKHQDEQLALLVGLTPTDLSELDIVVGIYPTGDRTYLPQELQLMLLDEAGIAVMQTEARGSEYIQFQFRSEPGESFSVKVALGDLIITENFFV